MKLHIRFDESNAAHTRATFFMNGKNCGQLTIGDEDLLNFLLLIRNGLHPTDEYLETGHVYIREGDKG